MELTPVIPEEYLAKCKDMFVQNGAVCYCESSDGNEPVLRHYRSRLPTFLAPITASCAKLVKTLDCRPWKNKDRGTDLCKLERRHPLVFDQ